MSIRFHVTIAVLIGVMAVAASTRAAGDRNADASRAPTKEGTVGAQMLLPLFLVDTLTPGGVTTLFAIRNESTSPVDVVVRYYGADRPDQPQSEQTIALAGKAVQTVAIDRVVEPLNLQVDPDGIARGFVTFATEQGEAVIHGDYFLINDGENFASGSRLVNIDPASNGNDLCNRFSMRFLDSALLFDSGTVYTVWIQSDEPLTGDAFSYSVYSQAGGNERLSSSFPASDVAFQVSANLLMSADPGLDFEFGAIEFQFPAGLAGHISAVMDAFGRYSVGYEATCLDPT